MTDFNRQDGVLGAIRSAFLWFTLLSSTLALCLLSLPLIIFRLSGAMHRVGVFWAWLLVKLAGVTVEVENRELLEKDGPFIVLVNHQSLFDVLVLYRLLPFSFTWMAKASLFKIPFFGWALGAIRAIPVVRDDRKKSLESLYNAADRVRSGQSVIVFPEGTRGFPDGRMRSFKKGGFILARRAAVKLQPITLHGASSVIPPKQGRFMQRIYPGKVRVVVHPPMYPESYAGLSLEELTAEVYRTIERPLERLQSFADTLEGVGPLLQSKPQRKKEKSRAS